MGKSCWNNRDFDVPLRNPASLRVAYSSSGRPSKYQCGFLCFARNFDEFGFMASPRSEDCVDSNTILYVRNNSLERRKEKDMNFLVSPATTNYNRVLSVCYTDWSLTEGVNTSSVKT